MSWIVPARTLHNEGFGVHSHAADQNAHPIQLPIGTESKFVGIIDLLKMKAFLYHDEEEKLE